MATFWGKKSCGISKTAPVVSWSRLLARYGKEAVGRDAGASSRKAGSLDFERCADFRSGGFWDRRATWRGKDPLPRQTEPRTTYWNGSGRGVCGFPARCGSGCLTRNAAFRENCHTSRPAGRSSSPRKDVHAVGELKKTPFAPAFWTAADSWLIIHATSFPFLG